MFLSIMFLSVFFGINCGLQSLEVMVRLWIPDELRVATPLDQMLCTPAVKPRYALLINPFYAKDPHASFGKHVLTPSLALTSIAASTPGDWEVRYWDENLLRLVLPTFVLASFHLAAPSAARVRCFAVFGHVVLVQKVQPVLASAHSPPAHRLGMATAGRVDSTAPRPIPETLGTQRTDRPPRECDCVGGGVISSTEYGVRSAE